MATNKSFEIIGPLFGRGGWVETHPHIFPSENSARWQLRVMMDELVEANAIVRLCERWHATTLLESTIARIASAKAKAHTAARRAVSLAA